MILTLLAQMRFFAVVFLLVLTRSSTIKARKCPKECSCDDSKLTVVCAGKNLTEIPLGVDEITVKLDLKNNNFQMLPRGSFLHTPYLTHLSLQRCSISKVKEGAFRGLGRVVSLNLAYNKIDILYQESFDGLSSLKELHLDHNHIEEIQPGAFMQLGLLNVLALTHNRLVYIPNMAFQGLQNMKWLRLSYNSLNNLAPEAFAGLFALSRLSLDHNELQFFPTQTMTRLPEVKRLELSYNRMTYLGEGSVSMRKLTHLHLDHMSLQDLSDQAFSQARLLSHVDLGHNQLRYLEPLTGPTKLAILNLTGNPIYCDCHMRPLKRWATVGGAKLLGACAGPAHLSDEPLRTVTSSHLRCRSGADALKDEEEEEGEEQESDGDITATATPKQTVKCPLSCECDTEAHHATCESRGFNKVPQGFPTRTQLLDLRGNHFHFIPTSSFPGTGRVVSLHLELCKIHEIEGGAFQGMRNLLYLYLSDNDLTSLEPEAFAGVPKLTYLHLEGNRLTQVPGAALSLLPNLFVLHLERNAISKLEPAGLPSSAAPTLMDLYLSNNAISGIAKGALSFAPIGTLHLDSNNLTEVPADALADAPRLEELNLSGNSVRWIGPRAFRHASQSLRRLYMDRMGIEKMSKEALLGLGPGLTVLTVRGNQLRELPDLSALTGLETIDLRDNPLLCDCALLPLRRWIDNAKLEVAATCGHPLELRGQQVADTNIFATCPENATISTEMGAVGSRPVKIKSARVKARPGKPKLDKVSRTQHRRKAAKQKAKNKKMNEAKMGN
ncbi:chondroadherin-like protein isoform X1 [Fundulus heteroclitus]|uniref:chondroadherin-like protein isoform X1 n=2 Tax=Fundulus heteroclitus TaxID=8078 RepID=UPI00165A1A80|nr:chondroadherin-like protein isoform X1 [Fundulus heteroclitus]